MVYLCSSMRIRPWASPADVLEGQSSLYCSNSVCLLKIEGGKAMAAVAGVWWWKPEVNGTWKLDTHHPICYQTVGQTKHKTSNCTSCNGTKMGTTVSSGTTEAAGGYICPPYLGKPQTHSVASQDCPGYFAGEDLRDCVRPIGLTWSSTSGRVAPTHLDPVPVLIYSHLLLSLPVLHPKTYYFMLVLALIGPPHQRCQSLSALSVTGPAQANPPLQVPYNVLWHICNPQSTLRLFRTGLKGSCFIVTF